MTTPTTLRMKVDSISEELARDPALFSGVLDGLIKKAQTETLPAEVQSMADSIVQHTGCTKEAALKMAWGTYVKYVNPEFDKEGKKKLPPAFLKNIQKKKEEAKGKGKEEPKGKPPFLKKKADVPAEPGSAEAKELASKLAAGACAKAVVKGKKAAIVKKADETADPVEELQEKLAALGWIPKALLGLAQKLPGGVVRKGLVRAGGLAAKHPQAVAGGLGVAGGYALKDVAD